jgi:hypothetical protein
MAIKAMELTVVMPGTKVRAVQALVAAFYSGAATFLLVMA